MFITAELNEEFKLRIDDIDIEPSPLCPVMVLGTVEFKKYRYLFHGEG
jgi:hypothetical protein